MGTENNSIEELPTSVDPVDQLAGLLASEDGVTDEPKVDEDQEVDDQEVVDDDDEEDDDQEVDDDENLEDDDDSELEDDDDDDDEVEMFTIKVNGEEREITRDELIRGYQLDAVNTQKSQAVSEKEKAVDAHLTELTQLREQQVLALQGIKTNDQAKLEEFDKTDWNELKATDPDAFVLKREERRELVEKIQGVEQQQIKVVEEQQAQNMQLFNAAKAKAQEVLSGADGIPGWADEKKGPEIRKGIREFAEKMGFEEADLKTMIDPRALKLLNMARQFDELNTKGKDLASKKVRKSNPKSVKKIGKRVKKGSLQDQANKAKQSGDSKDAAAFIEGMLGL